MEVGSFERRLATVCARGGSGGVPGKNLRLLLGRPLVAHSVLHARGSGLFGAVVVSSDDEDILRAGMEAGADLAIRRPPELASDTASKIAAIQHATLAAEAELGARFDVIVDLDATSPLRTVEDVREVVRLLEETGVANVITAAPARRSPYFNLVELNERGVPNVVCPDAGRFHRRQDTPECFDMNASVYAWRRDVLFETGEIFAEDTRLYVMPRERSIDLDDHLDAVMIDLLAADRPDLRWEASPPIS